MFVPRHKGRGFRKGTRERGSWPDGYLIILPLGEVDLEGGQGELLAHPSLVVDGLGLQGRALGAVPEGAAERKAAETPPRANGLLHLVLRATP